MVLWVSLICVLWFVVVFLVGGFDVVTCWFCGFYTWGCYLVFVFVGLLLCVLFAYFVCALVNSTCPFIRVGMRYYYDDFMIIGKVVLRGLLVLVCVVFFCFYWMVPCWLGLVVVLVVGFSWFVIC